jgi:hypothetical protein
MEKFKNVNSDIKKVEKKKEIKFKNHKNQFIILNTD